MKLLKEIRENLAGGINIPTGLIIPPGPPSPQDPQGPLPPGPPQTPLSSLSSSSDSSSDLTSVTPIAPPPAPSVSLPTPSVSLPTIPTPSRIPSRIPISTSIQSQIPIPIVNPLDESKVPIPFIIKKRTPDPFDSIKKQSTDPSDNIKPSSKVSRDDNNGDIDDYSLYDCVPYNLGPGTATAIIAMERDIKNSYDNINYLRKKLFDTKNYDEYNKILNNIDQAKKIYPKKKKNYIILKWD